MVERVTRITNAIQNPYPPTKWTKRQKMFELVCQNLEAYASLPKLAVNLWHVTNYILIFSEYLSLTPRPFSSASTIYHNECWNWQWVYDVRQITFLSSQNTCLSLQDLFQVPALSITMNAGTGSESMTWDRLHSYLLRIPVSHSIPRPFSVPALFFLKWMLELAVSLWRETDYILIFSEYLSLTLFQDLFQYQHYFLKWMLELAVSLWHMTDYILIFSEYLSLTLFQELFQCKHCLP